MQSTSPRCVDGDRMREGQTKFPKAFSKVGLPTKLPQISAFFEYAPSLKPRRLLRLAPTIHPE